MTKSHQETGATHPKLKTKIKRGITIEPRTTVCETFPEWLEEVTDSLEDTEVLAPAHMSHDSDSERPTQVALGNCSVYTLFPKRPGLRSMLANQDDKGLLAEDALPKQYLEQKSWGADDKVLNEGCESRNNHRYAVVVQDLATQLIQSYPCKTKTSQETEKSLLKFLEPSEQPNVIYTDNSLEFGKSCEDLSWNHRTSTPRRSETNGVA